MGYDFGGISVLHDGHLRNANPGPALGGVERIVEGRDGAIWVAANGNGYVRLSRLLDGRWTQFGADRGIDKLFMGGLFAASDGSVYLAAPPKILRLAPGAAHFEPTAVKTGEFSDITEDGQGRLWLADEHGLQRLGDGASPPIRLGAVNTPHLERRLLCDRDGALWIAGEDEGLARLRPGPGGGFFPPDRDRTPMGVSSVVALSMIEDREGNLWIGTESGLERLSPDNVVQSRMTEPMVTGFVGGSGSKHVFFAGISGVYRAGRDLAEPELIFRKSSIGVICGDERQLFVVSMDGAFLLSLNLDGRLKNARSIAGPLTVTCARDTAGTIWAGMDHLYRVDGARLVSATGAGAEDSGRITHIAADPRGGLIAGRTMFGIERIVDGRASLLWKTSQGQVGATNGLIPQGDILFQGGQKGLARYDGRGLVALTERAYPVLAGITGIRRTGNGFTWLIGTMGIIRVADADLDAAFRKPGTRLPFERFGYEDGFRARSNTLDTHDIAQDSSGRIWFATNRGLAWIDPERLGRNRLVPTVVIRALIAGSIRRTPGDGDIRLPVGTSRVEIDYSALSLTDAPANSYRYRLDGADRGWVEAGHERQALYTNLGPGTYRFDLVAANNDGVWNPKATELRFTIAPAFYQTRWFALLCILIAAGLLWLFYRWRLGILAERARGRFEAQLAERERIARELHDTLLQGFQGLMLRFQSVVELLPLGHRARATLEGALERADDVLLESRERVHSLREDLRPVALGAHLDRVAEAILHPPLRYSLVEQGRQHLVCAPVAEEIGQVVREALTNIVLHARAGTVTLMLRYRKDRLIVSVQDDGIGIPPDILEAGGRVSHYGLVGMRERVEHLAGAIEISSRARQGTKILISIPSRIAFQ